MCTTVALSFFPACADVHPVLCQLFHSHQFWHCAIVAAIALHWWALTTMSEKVGSASFDCRSAPSVIARLPSCFSNSGPSRLFLCARRAVHAAADQQYPAAPGRALTTRMGAHWSFTPCICIHIF